MGNGFVILCPSYFLWLPKEDQASTQCWPVGRWVLSQLDCKYPRCSICWCYCQVPWALGHSLWGGFATWGRRLIYAVFQYLATTQRSLFKGAYFRVQWHMALGKEYGNSWAPENCNSFMWLMAHDKCWTVYWLTQCGLPGSHILTLLSLWSGMENIKHLLTSCVFAQDFLFNLQQKFGLQALSL